MVVESETTIFCVAVVLTVTFAAAAKKAGPAAGTRLPVL